MKSRWYNKPLLFLVLFLFLVQLTIAQEAVKLLTSGWKFRKAGSADKWLPASIPGNVYTDLYANKLIPDPFLGCNSNNLKWVDECDWEYQTQFIINSDIFLRSDTELEFKGLDTYAKVYLNDTLILTANNMFRSWKIDCSKYVRIGGNLLRVVFSSAQGYVNREVTRLPYKLPGGDWAYIRKPAYHFGWDWAPTFKTCGIWKKVVLRTKPDYYIENFNFKTLEINASSALVLAEFEVNSPRKQQVSVEIIENNSRSSLMKEKAEVQKGKTRIQTKFTISNPKLWWPNGMGSQYLYSLSCRILNRDDKLVVFDRLVGLRTIEVVTTPDNLGETFFFKVNGTPLFAKGSNVVPPNSFISSVRDNEWISLVDDAKLSNMNMLRVWGGGVYPPDAFYEACSKKGILVWQDFMFACSMYPWDSLFLKNVGDEITEQVLRLREFPCIALYCGNNEIDEGWHNWGWSKPLDTVPNAINSIWNGYKSLFNNLIPNIIKEYDSKRFYWPSSPLYGWGKKESMLKGDSHYWGVWWGFEPFEVYKEKIPRFMSEYGFQAFPDARTVLAFSTKGDEKPSSSENRCHQKHPVGFETIEKYMRYEQFSPKSFDDSIYLSQIVQSIGYRIAIESHRLAMPYCMGTLYWQMNDCWPGVSWSGIDFYKRWKAVQYTIREAYKPILVSAEVREKEITIRAVSDYQVPVEGELKVLYCSLNGDILRRWVNPVTIKPNISEQILKVTNECSLADSSNVFVYVEFESNNGESFSYTSFYCKAGNLKLLNPAIKVKIEKIDERSTLVLTSSIPAFYVQISSALPGFKVDNNYFNMLPGKEYRINVLAGDVDKIEIKSLFDFLH